MNHFEVTEDLLGKEPQKKKKSLKWLFIIFGLIVIAGFLILGAYFFLRKGNNIETNSFQTVVRYNGSIYISSLESPDTISIIDGDNHHIVCQLNKTSKDKKEIISFYILDDYIYCLYNDFNDQTLNLSATELKGSDLVKLYSVPIKDILVYSNFYYLDGFFYFIRSTYEDYNYSGEITKIGRDGTVETLKDLGLSNSRPDLFCDGESLFYMENNQISQLGEDDSSIIIVPSSSGNGMKLSFYVRNNRIFFSTLDEIYVYNIETKQLETVLSLKDRILNTPKNIVYPDIYLTDLKKYMMTENEMDTISIDSYDIESKTETTLLSKLFTPSEVGLSSIDYVNIPVIYRFEETVYFQVAFYDEKTFMITEATCKVNQDGSEYEMIGSANFPNYYAGD